MYNILVQHLAQTQRKALAAHAVASWRFFRINFVREQYNINYLIWQSAPKVMYDIWRLCDPNIIKLKFLVFCICFFVFLKLYY